MNSTELLELWRREIGDTESPFLWSDEDAYGYIDDAQTMFCRRTDGIADSTDPDITRISVVPNTDEVTLHRTIKLVRTAKRLDTGRPIKVLDEEQLNSMGFYLDGKTGDVQALVIGADAGKARVYPKSRETMTVVMSVFRLPKTRITDDGDQTLEIDEQHHRHLTLWMNALAYRRNDAETFDARKSQANETAFINYCEQVQAEQRRRRYTRRAIQYGGL